MTHDQDVQPTLNASNHNLFCLDIDLSSLTHGAHRFEDLLAEEASVLVSGRDGLANFEDLGEGRLLDGVAARQEHVDDFFEDFRVSQLVDLYSLKGAKRK